MGGILLREREGRGGSGPTSQAREGKRGGVLLRGTKGRKRRREGTEREAKGIPPKVNMSRINTGMTGWSDHWESLKKSCLVMYNIKRWSKKL